MLKDPITILYDNFDQKIGSPQDLQKLIENPEGIEIDKAVEIPQKVEEAPLPKTAPSTVNASKVKSEEPAIFVPTPKPKAAGLPANVDLFSNNYMPIKALNTFTRDWVIKARVANRSELRTTQKGGQLLKIELVDSYGTQIEGTFFNDSAKKYSPLLEKNKIYLFSNGMIKMANKKFSSLKNDFCIIFEKLSDIQEANDDGTITNQAFDFCQISEIPDIMPMKTIDVVGVISLLGDKEEINLKNGTTKMRRQIQLVDDSEKSVSLTFWGEELCSRDDLTLGDVLAVKAGRVSEFGGRSLNCSHDHASLYRMNELKENPEAIKIQTWRKRILDQNTGDIETAFEGYECLTVKP